MRKTTLIIFIILFTIVYTADTELVHIPDENLKLALARSLNLPFNVNPAITKEDMRHLTRLELHDKGIKNLTGLEHASNLTKLYCELNPINDLSPIATLITLESLSLWGTPGLRIDALSNLTNLIYLDIAGCHLINLSPLTSLTKLRGLNARHNHIVDINALANLAALEELDLSNNRIHDISALSALQNLTHVWLHHNQITDFTPLANLTRLERLEIQHNRSTDLNSLIELSIGHFVYDQICVIDPFPLRPRLVNRTYPSIFYRWNREPITNRPELSHLENLAHHDLRWGGSLFDLTFLEHPNGFYVAGNINRAIQQRQDLHTINPNMIHLFDVGMRAAPLHWFPEDSPVWVRDNNGDIFIEVYGGQPVSHGLLDFTKAIVQDRIVEQAIAVSKCGLYDGIFFDYWSEVWPVLGGFDGMQDRFFHSIEDEQNARDIILRRIRDATHPDFLIMGNTNDRIIPRTAPSINGSFMETGMPGAKTFDERLERKILRVENSLLWLDQNLREPRTNCLEGYAIIGEAPDSPNNLRWMRVLTTLSLTHSDGYVLFQPLDREGHYWYDFWDADLGRPVGGKGQLYQETNGLYIREYTNGWAVYNHSGAPQVITLPEEVQGAASGLVNTEHALPNLDGEMYLRMKPKNPADVNGDGVVNLFDLTLVAQAIGTGGAQGDVNGDSVVNVFDLVQVAAAIGGGGAAPSAYSPELSIISAANVERWLADAQGLGIGDATFQQGIRFLEGLLAGLTPKETTLLPNYPSPFNPETWIPYRLAREAEVAITIYDTKGTQVRRLALGNQEAGHYAERGKAAYWDGRNERGEAVASGIYIYQFRAGDYAASRRMVIVK